ncbi:protein ANTAGONIST OF LIKE HETEROCHROMATIN PROTEIN 1-like isoform X1 [Zea mays]|uniref:protein ANTAGONIST OF LIKE HETEROCHROMATIN PROTEIN 1-like isoform X1 n=2 Tax=Zea mays TaxID=4577 RepID=UPI0016533A47|nr:protein ANTAGONIST OF LIKE HETEROCHROMATIN PROTEIN 1-like isoform X1 [Zea mays]
MAIIANRYQWRRPRHIVDANEVQERNVESRKQMLRNMYQGSNVYCYDSLRLTKRSFSDLSAILREKSGLQDTLNVSVEEKLAIFLLIVGHNTKMRLIRSTYGWSLEPISRHFNEVLRGILFLSHEFIKLPNPETTLPEDPKWKWFEDCLGALDGTHIDVNVPLNDQGRYRNRKQRITTNVLGVCDRQMKFLYVLAGWEGSASDSRILRDAMSREDSFVVPSGKFYLVDDGYTNGPGFLAPYRSTRYHLNEWAIQGNNPSTARELFNLRHATARNVIERTFGLLKMRWAILRTSSYFDLENQIRIIHACCILHNFLRDRQRDMDDILIHEVDSLISAAPAENQGEMSLITHVQSTNEWGNFRDTKASEMFVDYQARRGQSS